MAAIEDGVATDVDMDGSNVVEIEDGPVPLTKITSVETSSTLAQKGSSQVK